MPGATCTQSSGPGGVVVFNALPDADAAEEAA